MFTGLIEEVGVISLINTISEKHYFKIDCKKVLSDTKIGGSIACNGICLTVIKKEAESIIVEVMNETFEKTTAKFWEIGSKINLERALKIGKRLEGHFVSGHVDTIGGIIGKTYLKNTLYIEFEVERKFLPFIVEQGSIAINGISLTIAKLTEYGFKVALIGHTLENTNLKYERNYVNLEFDILGKYILNLYDNILKEREEKILKNFINGNRF